MGGQPKVNGLSERSPVVFFCTTLRFGFRIHTYRDPCCFVLPVCLSLVLSVSTISSVL